MNESIISVTNLVKRYDKLTAVDDISFSVQAGEVFGFLGPNGAGKTTTINIICTLLSPTSGTVHLNGYDVTKDPAAVRRSLGIVFQDASLDERLTAEENLEFHAMLYGVDRATTQKRIDKLLDMVELVDRRKDEVKFFSGGMKRRLEIARGLLHYPKVLFLDEPTLGLDPQTRSHIWDHILSLHRTEQITVFLTTHYMEEAENCDRIAIIDHGKIVALDTPRNLKKSVGGDIVRIETAEPESAARDIRKSLGIEAELDETGLRFEIQEASTKIASLLREMPFNVRSIHVSEPTLDDVFIKITGRALRDEELGAADRFKAHIRRQTGRRGH